MISMCYCKDIATCFKCIATDLIALFCFVSKLKLLLYRDFMQIYVCVCVCVYNISEPCCSPSVKSFLLRGWDL